MHLKSGKIKVYSEIIVNQIHLILETNVASLEKWSSFVKKILDFSLTIFKDELYQSFRILANRYKFDITHL
eukprot:UN22272